MTDNTQPDSASTTGSTHIIRYALELGLLWIDGDGRDKVREALDALDTLEAQLEAIGAGGVSGPLMARASLSANAGEPVAWQYRSLPDVGGVWFECSKERAELRAAHPERWEVRPLYAAPPTAQAEGWRLIETAPKDGETKILLLSPGEIFIGVRPTNCRNDAAASLGGTTRHPSHWMPLPPTSAEGVEHG